MKLEDLKVGQYVRFKDKKGNTYIRKIKEVCTKNPEKMWGAIIIDKNANNVPYVSLKNIVKTSFDVIDILEVGDYVNGYKVSFKDNDYKPFVQCDYPVQEGTTNHYRFYEEAIYSIVTKEQFESMSYKFGE